MIEEIKALCVELAIECDELELMTMDEDVPYDEWDEGRLTGMLYVLNQLRQILKND